MQSHAQSFAQIESDWTFREGVSFLIRNISCTKQSNLLLHFLFVKIFRDSRVFILIILLCLPVEEDICVQPHYGISTLVYNCNFVRLYCDFCGEFIKLNFF